MIALISHIETLIRNCAGPREKLMIKLNRIETEDEAFELLNEVSRYKPIMGLESIPTNVNDAMEATRLRIEREDFKERDNKR